MWCLLLNGGVVPITVARIMGEGPYYSQRTGSNCGGVCNMGALWRGKTILCRCDNAAVVAIVRSGSSKNNLAMHLMRCLSFYTAYYQLYLETVYLPGKFNVAADALSRDNLPLFLQLVPEACQSCSRDPHSLANPHHTTRHWTSPTWTNVLPSTLVKV